MTDSNVVVKDSEGNEIYEIITRQSKEYRARFYNWCFTIFFNKESKEDLEIYKHFAKTDGFSMNISSEKIQYLVAQLETCPSTGKLHIQGYVEFTEKYSMKWIKELFKDNSMHLGPRRGTQEQAIKYCTKIYTRLDDTQPFFYGFAKSQGNRSDLDSIVDAIENGMTTKEILHLFRGNALRHIGMIERGLYAQHEMSVIDNVILMRRQYNYNHDDSEEVNNNM